MHKREQPLVFLGRPKKFERNAAGTHGPDHRSHFERRLVILKRDLKIKDIIHVHRSLALDNAPAHRNVQDGSLSPHFAARERQKQAHRNTQMFSPIQHLRRITASQSESLKMEATRLTMERRNAGKRLQPLHQRGAA